MRTPSSSRDLTSLVGGLGALAALVMGLRVLGNENPTTVALALLLVILGAATLSRMWVAIVLSVFATAGLNFFFLPPVGTFRISEPQNWIALVAFLTVGIIASQLSTAAQARARDAVERRNEVTRLFDLSRDVLLTGDSPDAVATLARHIARRFELQSVAICVPTGHEWRVHQGGDEPIVPTEQELDLALARARGTLEFDARQRTYGGHMDVADTAGRTIRLVPLRLGVQAVGLLATSSGAIDPGALDAVGGVAAIAIERAQLLNDRATAELVRQRADLASALLASLSHDLRTPLTAIQVAVSNLRQQETEEERLQQAAIALRELDRLNHLFEDILDMARIDANTITAERQWVSPADIVDAALAHVGHALDDHELRVDADDATVVEVDPRLTSSALAHLVENAARYSGSRSRIDVRGRVESDGLRISVTDSGPGLDPAEVEHLFQPFFRGRSGLRKPGTGMGLAITRGLLAAEDGRVWGENAESGGARFSIAVPGRSRPAAAA